MDMPFVLASALIVSIRVALCCWFLAPFPHRALPWWQKVCVLVGFAVVTYVFEFIYKAQFFIDATLIRCLFTVLFTVAWVELDRRSVILVGLGIAITFQAAGSAVLYFFLGTTGITIPQLETDQLARIMLEVAGSAIAAIPLWVMRRRICSLTEDDITTPYLCALIFPLVIIALVSAWKLPSIDERSPIFELAPIAVAAVAELSAVVATVLIVYALATRKGELEAAKLESLIRAQHESLLVRNSSEEALARVMHDLKNHLVCINELTDQQAIAQHVGQIREELRELERKAYTGNATLDIVLNEKAALARARGIDLQVMMDFSGGEHIKSVDICAIFGNALDNALRAASEVPDPHERLVVVKSAPIAGFLTVRISNRFSTPVVWDHGVLMSTRREGREEGLGLRSIKHSLSKYGGVMETQIENGSFSLLMTIPMPNRDAG